MEEKSPLPVEKQVEIVKEGVKQIIEIANQMNRKGNFNL